VLRPGPHDAHVSGCLVPAALGAVLGTGQPHSTGICSSDGGTEGAAGLWLHCLGTKEGPRRLWEGRMDSASLSTGTALGGSWGRHPSSLLSWLGCPAHRHCGEHAEGAVCSLSPARAGVAKQPCSPMHVWDRGTQMGHPLHATQKGQTHGSPTLVWREIVMGC